MQTSLEIQFFEVRMYVNLSCMVDLVSSTTIYLRSMNSFLKLYASFILFTPGKVARMAYQNATPIQKICLWGSKLCFAVFWITYLISANNTLYFIAAISSAPIWGFSFRSALKHLISKFQIDPLALKLYWKDHQAIRYALFSAALEDFINTADLDLALNHLNIEINTGQSPALFSPSVQVFGALFLAIVGGVVGEWDKELVTAILVATGLYVSLQFSLHRLSKPRLDHLREFQRFLMWKKSELDTTKKSTPVWRHREKQRMALVRN